MSESRSLDLHEFTVPEAIGAFVRFYNACLRSGYRGRIEVIHGYGSTGAGGTIRKELRKYLEAHAAVFGEYLAGESLRNPGVTILYIKETLAPPPRGQGSILFFNPAQEAIRRFCNTPKSKDQILTKLTGRFGDRVLGAEIRNLVNNGALRAIRAPDGTIRYKARSEP